MTKDSPPPRSSQTRTSLGDLTNQLGKRGFSLISRSPASKSAKIFDKENDSQSAKRISLGSKDSGSETSGAKCPKISNHEKSLPLLKGGKTYRLLSLGNVDSALDPSLKIQNQIGSADANLSLNCSGSVSSNVKGTHANSQSSSESTKDLFEMGGIGKSQDPEEPILDALGSQIASTDGKDFGFSTMPSTEYLPLPGSKPFELERCALLKDDAASDAVPDANSLKACSCSFCAKAAYIWADLHYADAKGRISALTKSKKRASDLVKTYSVESNMGRSGESPSSSPTQMDMDLMNRCKSLFVFMDDSFGKECSQLEAEILSLKGMREDTKTNVGTIHEMPLDVHHSTSTDPDPSCGRRVA